MQEAVPHVTPNVPPAWPHATAASFAIVRLYVVSTPGVPSGAQS
jgi:hypothetical protein